MWRQVTTNYSQPLTLRLPGTEAVQGPCEEEDRGDPAPSCGGVRGVRDPSSRVEEVPQEVPTAGPEYSADSSSCPAALGSEEGQVLGGDGRHVSSYLLLSLGVLGLLVETPQMLVKSLHLHHDGMVGRRSGHGTVGPHHHGSAVRADGRSNTLL